MSERWCFVVLWAFVTMLLVGYFPSATLQAAVNGGQQEPCTTSSNQAGYCMQMESCHSSAVVDLRMSGSCTDTSLLCCPTVIAPSWSKKAQHTECDSNRGYCVKSDMCGVRTFRLRSNRCPLFEEVCCPKNKVLEETTEPTKVAVTTTTPSSVSSTTIASSTITISPTVSGNKTTASDSTFSSTSSPAVSSTSDSITSSTTNSDIITTTTPHNSPSASETPVLVSSSATTTKTATESLSTSTAPTSEVDKQKASPEIKEEADQGAKKGDPIVENSTVHFKAPATTDSSDIIFTVMPEFAPENFTNQGCGVRNTNGVLEHTIDQEFRSEYGEFPWMVALFQQPEMSYCCNGALIDTNVILTTAHCIRLCGNSDNNILVRLGEWNLNSTVDTIIPRKDIGVKKVYEHPNFSTTSLINNIAMLVLKESVQYQATIQPVCLPSESLELKNHQDMIATGWGAMYEGISVSNQILKRLDLQGEGTSICRENLRSVQKPFKFELHESFVCAKTGHPDQERPCDGDAGSPVVVEVQGTVDRYYLHGLVSWGYGCKQKRNTYTVMTHVVHFRKWIEDILESLKRKNMKSQKKSGRRVQVGL